MRLITLVLLSVGWFSAASAQVRVYVDADAEAGGDGTSWSTAFHDLQDALQLARDEAGTVSEIWVAEGTYYPTDGDDRSVSFDLVDGVSLFGGFEGTEQSLEERDLARDTTSLSGDIEGWRSLHVVRANDVTATLDGLHVRDGYGSIFDGIAKGAGIYSVGGHLTLRNVQISHNEIEDPGSAAARGGAGLYLEGGAIDMQDVVFLYNYGDLNGGGAFILDSEVNIRSTRFESNGTGVGEGRGGALHVRNSEVTIGESEFVNNGASGEAWGFGGALYVAGGSLLVVSSRFEDNRVRSNAYSGVARGSRGGAIFYSDLEGDPGLLANVTFTGNTARSLYGDIKGAAVYIPEGSAPLRIVNATFTQNKAFVNDGGGGAGSGGVISGLAVLENTIVWGNDGSNILRDGVTASHAIIEGGYEGESILDADPLFVQSPSDLNLQPGSPAIDCGSVEHLPADALDLDNDGDTDEALPLDLAGGPRVIGAEVNLGAYEGTAEPAPEGPGCEDPDPEDPDPEDPDPEDPDPEDPDPEDPDPEDPGSLLQIEAYPTPARSSFTVEVNLPEPEVVVAVVYDSAGRRVTVLHEGTMPAGRWTHQVSTAGLPAGVYFVRVEGTSVKETISLVVQ